MLRQHPQPKPKQPATLAIGDDAPPITIDHWVKGGAIEDFEDGQVYVMEFWATWCPPCVMSMPHLSGLQDEYGDTVKIIGVSSEQELETVTSFLEKTNKSDNMINNDRMRYTVAFDSDRSTSTSFMKAAGQKFIPTAFIIDADGKVAWIGGPMSMDEPLAEIVNGTWDLAAASAAFEKEAMKNKKEAMKDKAMDTLLGKYSDPMQNEDWDGWIASIDEFAAEYNWNTKLYSMKFDALLNGKKDKAAAYAWAETMVESDWDNANALNGIAWGIVDRTPADLQDLDFALKVAIRACELTDNKNSSLLDTLARAYWERGETYKAIAWQEKLSNMLVIPVWQIQFAPHSMNIKQLWRLWILNNTLQERRETELWRSSNDDRHFFLCFV